MKDIVGETMAQYYAMRDEYLVECKKAGPCMYCKQPCPPNTRDIYALICWFFCPACLSDARIRAEIDEWAARSAM